MIAILGYHSTCETRNRDKGYIERPHRLALQVMTILMLECRVVGVSLRMTVTYDVITQSEGGCPWHILGSQNCYPIPVFHLLNSTKGVETMCGQKAQFCLESLPSES